MDNIKEEWKPIKYDNYHKHTHYISSLGRCRVVGQYYDIIYVPKEPKNKKSVYDQYCGKKLHQWVAEMFIPNPDNKPYIDHIDGNKHNNTIYNLRWVTPKENRNNPNNIERKLTKKAEHKLKNLRWMYKDNDDIRIDNIKVEEYKKLGYKLGRKGKEPWNKGKKGLQKGPNKNRHREYNEDGTYYYIDN